jgi:hypothetical protein
MLACTEVPFVDVRKAPRLRRGPQEIGGRWGAAGGLEEPLRRLSASGTWVIIKGRGRPGTPSSWSTPRGSRSGHSLNTIEAQAASEAATLADRWHTGSPFVWPDAGHANRIKMSQAARLCRHFPEATGRDRFGSGPRGYVGVPPNPTIPCTPVQGRWAFRSRVEGRSWTTRLRLLTDRSDSR